MDNSLVFVPVSAAADVGQFGPPHADALDDRKSGEVVRAIEALLDVIGH